MIKKIKDEAGGMEYVELFADVGMNFSAIISITRHFWDVTSENLEQEFITGFWCSLFWNYDVWVKPCDSLGNTRSLLHTIDINFYPDCEEPSLAGFRNMWMGLLSKIGKLIICFHSYKINR